MIKAIYMKAVAKIKISGEKLKTFPLKSGIRQGFPISPYLFNIVLEVLAREIRLEMGIKGIQIGKEEVKHSLFADNMIVYISDPKNYQVMLMADNHLQQCSGYKINSKMSVDLLYTDDISNEKEIRETSPFTISTSNI